VRLIDHVVRRGHLSERALTDALILGERPQHLDRCDLCAERASDLSRWLNHVETDAREMADDMFAPENLAAQQAQILRRLEQMDNPVRVIAFPAASRQEAQGNAGRRVAVSWVGVAAAAGLLVGIVGGQITARMAPTVTPAVTVSAADTSAEPTPDPVDASIFEHPFETSDVRSMEALDMLTPRMVTVSARSGG
jgi:hypothetical protein